MAVSQKAVQTLHSLAGISTQEARDTQVKVAHSYNITAASMGHCSSRGYQNPGHLKIIPYILLWLFSSPTDLMCKFRKCSLN